MFPGHSMEGLQPLLMWFLIGFLVYIYMNRRRTMYESGEPPRYTQNHTTTASNQHVQEQENRLARPCPSGMRVRPAATNSEHQQLQEQGRISWPSPVEIKAKVAAAAETRLWYRTGADSPSLPPTPIVRGGTVRSGTDPVVPTAAVAEKRIAASRASGVLSSVSGLGEDSVASLAPTLRVLSLQDQGLAALPLLALPLPNLTRAFLSGNRLSSLPDPLALPRIEKLDLSRNDLQHLPNGGWESMRLLKELRMSHNKMASLPPGMSLLGCLRTLDMSHNRIVSIDPLAALHGLTDLDASYNLIEELPVCMDGMKSLKRLDVEQNLLEALPQGLLEGTRVERILAGGNPLTLKEQKGFDAYLERKRRRVVEDGKVYEFSHAEVAHQKEKERRQASGAL